MMNNPANKEQSNLFAKSNYFLVKVPEQFYKLCEKSKSLMMFGTKKEFGELQLYEDGSAEVVINEKILQATQEAQIQLVNKYKFQLTQNVDPNPRLIIHQLKNDPDIDSHHESTTPSIRSKIDCNAKMIPSLESYKTNYPKDKPPHKSNIFPAKADVGNDSKKLKLASRHNEYVYNATNSITTQQLAQRRENKEKRVRKDKMILQNELFELFKINQHWNLKTLIQQTDQPEAYLKQVLGEICEFNKRGPLKGFYHLKEQFLE